MPKFTFGIEEFANLRIQARLRDKAVVVGAVNLLAAAGNYAVSALQFSSGSPLAVTSYVEGKNYIAGIELERLYFRIFGEYINFDGGLMRIPFGYGQVWGSSDFLSSRNPLRPDARPRAILGAALAWFPIDGLKLLTFFSAPENVFSWKGEGFFFGLSVDKHWNKASIQGLYSFETPQQALIDSSLGEIFDDTRKYGVHRFGLSVKADLVVGLVLDALYTYNHKERTKEEGLSLSAGIDYSFLGGDLVVLAEYLYNGKTSSTALKYGGEFSNNHYLYTGLTVRFNDFTNMNIALMSSFDDISFTPVITFNYDLFQGALLTITAQVPMDRDLFHKNGKRGELGPIPPGIDLGRYFVFSARLRLRF